MSVDTLVALIGVGATILIAIISSAWYISARVEKTKVVVDFTATTIKEHIEKDDRRFDEIFRNMQELAKQNFWLIANRKPGNGGISPNRAYQDDET